MLETWPDIMFTVAILSRFTAYHQVKYDKALNHVFCYLNGTIHLEITYSHSESRPPIPFGYSDSNYAGMVVKKGCKSISSFIFFLAEDPVSWSCKHQSVIAMLLTEAEYIT